MRPLQQGLAAGVDGPLVGLVQTAVAVVPGLLPGIARDYDRLGVLVVGLGGPGWGLVLGWARISYSTSCYAVLECRLI